MKYKSQTVWQADNGWELIITIQGFNDIFSAVQFSIKSFNNLSYNSFNRELIAQINKSYRSILDSEVLVSKLKPESREKLITDDEDFQTINLSIEQFWSIAELNGTFECLTYRVIDENNNPVNSTIQHLEVIQEQIKAIKSYVKSYVR